MWRQPPSAVALQIAEATVSTKLKPEGRMDHSTQLSIHFRYSGLPSSIEIEIISGNS
jgi:hypothetical protein